MKASTEKVVNLSASEMVARSKSVSRLGLAYALRIVVLQWKCLHGHVYTARTIQSILSEAWSERRFLYTQIESILSKKQNSQINKYSLPRSHNG